VVNANLGTTDAERAGRWLGRARRGFARQEACAIRWLASQGLSVSVAGVLLWIVKLVVIGALFFAAFWLALVFALAVIAIWLARSADRGEGKQPEPEWRNGLAGFGFYTYDEHRIDPHVEDDD
jgi:hypothetical protein